MKPLQYIIPAFIVLALIYTSCEPIEKVGEVPEIEFKSYTPVMVDTYGIQRPGAILAFTFKDGDADFGIDRTLENPDTANLYLHPYQKLDGRYDSVDFRTYGRWYPILRDEKMDRTSGNTTVKGEIQLTIVYFLPPPFDTIRYDFYITDRAGNKSNVETTTDIAVSDMTFPDW
ncbi:MAG: hypothetical protein R6X09_13240 [Bacteroidales bacterium]